MEKGLDRGKEKDKKKVQNGQSQKMSKFWLIRKHQIKIFHIFVPNLGENYTFLKNSFISKTKAHLTS